AHDHRADVLLRLVHDAGTGVDLAAFEAVRPPPRFQWDDPVVQVLTVDAERVLLALVGACGVAVHGHRDVESEHRTSSPPTSPEGITLPSASATSRACAPRRAAPPAVGR